MENKEITKIIKLYEHQKNRDTKIIEQKGNTKCIFYSDDVCRKGDRTRDCINCARVEYSNLYSLNWDNQENLYKQIQLKEEECNQYKQILEIIKKNSYKLLNYYEKHGCKYCLTKRYLNLNIEKINKINL